MRTGMSKACVAALGLGLLVASGAEARPIDVGASAAASRLFVKVKSVSSPPRRTMRPGARFTVTGSVRNVTSRTRTGRVQVTLRRTKATYPKKIGARRSARIKAGRTLRYRIRVTIPKTLANGN